MKPLNPSTLNLNLADAIRGKDAIYMGPLKNPKTYL